MEWKSFHNDHNLRKIIDLDIERTFQNYSIFKDKWIKAVLHNVLFIYAKINYVISYKQGMNEILALLVLVMWPYYHKTKFGNMYESLLAKVNEDSASLRDIYCYLFDEEEFEADIFCLFHSIMERGLKDMYYTPEDQIKNDSPLFKKCELFHSKWESSDNFKDIYKSEKLMIQQKCEKIFHKLEKIEKDLFQYLNSLEIDTFIILRYFIYL
jgi:hypothetical protein